MADRRATVWYLIGEYTGLAVMMPAAALIGFFIGYALDHWWGTQPVFEIVFVILGVIAGMLELFRVVKRTQGGSPSA